MRKQCELLGVARSTVGYEAAPEDPEDIRIKRLQRLRREIDHEGSWCKPRTNIPDHGHRKYPYLLWDLTVARPDYVWCTVTPTCQCPAATPTCAR